MLTRCVDCVQVFDARGDWQRRCYACYRDHKARTDAGKAYARGREDGIEIGRRMALRSMPRPTRETLDSDLLRSLIRLTHPDRHPAERAEEANAATATLLDLLAQTRQEATR